MSVELLDGRPAEVGGIPVTRLLPKARRRSVGAWCFVDHMGPAEGIISIGPHPHIGLQTVTWLLEGEAVHRDGLGTEQPIRPGQLNLMTAGRGLAHSEEGRRGRLHGVQLWVAQPDATRSGDPDFGHHAELPHFDVDGGGTATVLVGEVAGATSPARRDTDHVGVDLVLPAGRHELPVDPGHEHGLLPLEGAVRIEHPGPVAPLEVGRVAIVAPATSSVVVANDGPARLLLLGGTPFPEPLVMWWNYVARSRGEVVDAHRSWTADDGRFARVDSALPPIHVDGPAW